MGPRLIFDAADIVGESAVYDERRDALVWVDIGGKRIQRPCAAELTACERRTPWCSTG